MQSSEQFRSVTPSLRGAASRIKAAKVSLVFFCLIAFTTVCHAKVSVFFMGGQSNASPGWYDGVKETLTKSGKFDEVLVVFAAHPGKQSDMWKTSIAGNYYATDFFASDGTGILQKALENLKKQNKEYKFEGVFWFQGEAGEDRDAPENWKSNFLGMISSIKKDLSDANWNYVVSVIDVNPAFATPHDIQNTEALREVMLALPKTEPNAIVSDTRGLQRRDAWHLTREDAYAFGVASVTKYLAARSNSH